jgi:hypothetical protein
MKNSSEIQFIDIRGLAFVTVIEDVSPLNRYASMIADETEFT